MSDEVERQLLRELASSTTVAQGERELALFFDHLSREDQTKVGLEVSVAAGLSDDWELALRSIDAVLADHQPPVRQSVDISALWRARVLLELKQFDLVLKAMTSKAWPPECRIHVNYLTGRAFEGLGNFEQALLRYNAVQEQDPCYRDVSDRLQRL